MIADTLITNIEKYYGKKYEPFVRSVLNQFLAKYEEETLPDLLALVVSHYDSGFCNKLPIVAIFQKEIDDSFGSIRKKKTVEKSIYFAPEPEDPDDPYVSREEGAKILAQMRKKIESENRTDGLRIFHEADIKKEAANVV